MPIQASNIIIGKLVPDVDRTADGTFSELKEKHAESLEVVRPVSDYQIKMIDRVTGSMTELRKEFQHLPKTKLVEYKNSAFLNDMLQTNKE